MFGGRGFTQPTCSWEWHPVGDWVSQAACLRGIPYSTYWLWLCESSWIGWTTFFTFLDKNLDKNFWNTNVVDVIKIIRAQVARSVEAELNTEAITTLERKRAREREREGARKEMLNYVMLWYSTLKNHPLTLFDTSVVNFSILGIWALPKLQQPVSWVFASGSV